MRFRKGFISGRCGSACGGSLRTIWPSLYPEDAGTHVEVCSGRFRKGFIWTMRGSMSRSASNDFVKVVSEQSGVGCGGLLRTIS